jgi:hypothetical protein
LGFIAFEESGLFDVAMFADDGGEPLLSPRLLFDREKRGKGLGWVGGVLENRSDQGLAF